MTGEDRWKIAEQEATRDPIFLLQMKRIQIPEASFDNDLYVESSFFDAGGVFLTPSEHMTYMDLDHEDEKAVDEFWRNVEGMGNEELVGHELASFYWDTDNVWLTREEAEEHAEKRHYHYGKKGKDWRVYCVCAEGELARALAGGNVRGTNWLKRDKEDE